MESNVELPDIDSKCGEYFTYRDFIECSNTWKTTRIGNIPKQIETYQSIDQITAEILEPVEREFGKIYLTYGYSSQSLVKAIKQNTYPNITPSGDQHSGSELNRNGNLICDRKGIAADFYIGGINSLIVAQWVAKNTSFDRLYFYSPHSPFHVSIGPENNKKIMYMKGYIGGRHQPITYSFKKLLAHREC